MSWQSDYMEIAGIVARRSTCDRGRVGAILTRGRRIISTGYNGVPSRMPHCNHSNEALTTGEGCRNAVHAEVNTIAFAAKYGVETENTQVFVTTAPCLKCAQLLINAGVREVYFRDEYRETEGLDLLCGAGVLVYQVKEPQMSTLPTIKEYQPGVYFGESSYTSDLSRPPYDDRWGVARITGGAERSAVLGPSGRFTLGGVEELRPQQTTLFGNECGQVSPG